MINNHEPYNPLQYIPTSNSPTQVRGFIPESSSDLKGEYVGGEDGRTE